MELKTGLLNQKQILQLLNEHHKNMQELSPPESIHALDITNLQKSNITFFSLWQENNLAGIGALKEISAIHGEIKSMRTAKPHLRKRVAATLLQHIINVANARKYRKISLETGTASAFTAAHQLYLQYGFLPCEPFDQYTADPNSLFMSLVLENSADQISVN